MNGRNVKTTVSPDKKKLTIEVDLTAPDGTVSASGKSITIATTSGNHPVPDLPEEYRLSVNFYKPAPKKA